MSDEKDIPSHVEGHGTTLGAMADAPQVDMTPNQIREAYRASFTEHRMTFRHALKAYRWSLVWTTVMSATLIMEAYDNHLLSGFFSLPAFQQQFGERIHGKKVQYELNPAWQSGLAMGKLVGMIFGIQLNPYIVPYFGYKKLVLICLALMAALVFPLFFAKNNVTILLAEFFFNIPFGNITVLTQAYTLELMPLGLRHWGPAYCQFTRNIGTMIAAGILQAFVDNTTEWAWRLPVALQWVWPLPLGILIFLAPESPWWLARRGQLDEALKSLDRISDSSVDNEETLALIIHTIEYEKKLNFGSSIWDCFKKPDLRRTEIEVGVRAFDAIATFGLAAGTFFFENAGFSAKHAFALNLGSTALSTAASACTMFVLAQVGRRRLWMCGYVGAASMVGLIGILAVLKQSDGVIWAQGVVLLIHNTILALASAPLALVIGTETASVQLRQQTMSLGSNASLIWNIVAHFTSPYLLNASYANLAGKAAWIPFGVDLIVLFWSYFRLPETKVRSAEELDYLFAQNVPARQFAAYDIPAEALYGEAEAKLQKEAGVPASLPAVASLEA